MTSEKVLVNFQVSVEFKEAIGIFAQKTNQPSSDIIREAVAKYIGYNLSADNISQGRPKKYATVADRLEAQKARAAAKRKLVKMLEEDYEHAKHLGNVKSFEEYLRKRGIDPD